MRRAPQPARVIFVDGGEVFVPASYEEIQRGISSEELERVAYIATEGWGDRFVVPDTSRLKVTSYGEGTR